MIRASISPVILGGTGGVPRCFLCKKAETLADLIKAAFTLVIVVRLTLNRSAISSNFTALVFFDVSSNSMICARLINFALCIPVLLNLSNSFRWAAFSFISFFFRQYLLVYKILHFYLLCNI